MISSPGTLSGSNGTVSPVDLTPTDVENHDPDRVVEAQSRNNADAAVPVSVELEMSHLVKYDSSIIEYGLCAFIINAMH